MLVITAFFVFLGVVSTEYQRFVRFHPEMLFLMLVIYIASMCSLLCCESVARNVPINYIVLLLMTISQSYIL